MRLPISRPQARGETIEQKVNAEKMQEIADAMAEIVERVKMILEQVVDGARKSNAISVRIDQMSEKIGHTHKRVEEVRNRWEYGDHQLQELAQSVQEFTKRCG